MSKTRANPKALNKSAAQVAANAAADKARKAASRAALRAASKHDADTPPVADAVVEAQHVPTSNEAALLAEMAATGWTREQAAESMGVDPVTAEALPDPKADRYNGPMLALVSARQNYVKAANGILCNGDALATLCGQYSRTVVVRALVRALELGANPYTHLNAGQQSMNLRNRARRKMQDGALSREAVEAALAWGFEQEPKAA